MSEQTAGEQGGRQTPGSNVDAPVQSLLVPVDGSSSSIAAVRWALRLGRDLGAAVVLLQVIEDEGPLPTESERPPDGLDRVEWLSERRFGPVVQALGDALARCERRIESGPPPEVICRVASELHSSLIVMGSRGLSPAGRFLLGSVSDAVIRHAPCSVMVTR
jgi:nucleotide-binding universal stress UspA family protein